MRTNPISDVLKFLEQGAWTTYVFWLLTIASIVIAAINLRRDSTLRSIPHLWTWLARYFIGALWWQQSLWKLPPNFGGLRYWVEQMAKFACSDAQQHFVKDLVLPNFFLFAVQVYCAEVFVAVTLMLGLLSQVGALVGALMAINLWLGLYRSPAEWPWTYFFLVLLQITFLVQRSGRSLGVDAILLRRQQAAGGSGPWNRLSRFFL